LAVAGTTLAAAAASAQPVQLGSAASFGVIGRTGVINTGASTITGDVGVGIDGVLSGLTEANLAEGSSIHEGDAVAVQALQGARAAYAALAELDCEAANDLTGENLGGKSLAPGVYCFDGDAMLTGTLTLTGTGPWTFQVGGNLIVSANGTVLAAGVTSTCKGSEVHWQVGGAEATLGAMARFIGNLLAKTGIAVAAGAGVDGRLMALDGEVTLNDNDVAACSDGVTFPPHDPIKVTGGGQLAVQDEGDAGDDAAAILRGPIRFGRATFAFVAKPGTNGNGPTGHLLYLNHLKRGIFGGDPSSPAHGGVRAILGDVTGLEVLSVNEDGDPAQVRFNGECVFREDCTFSVIVEDNGEGWHRRELEPDHGASRRRDRFGLVVVSGDRTVESQPLGPIARGNIQFHMPDSGASLTTDLNDVEFSPGSVMQLTAALAPSRDPNRAPAPVDAYLVLQLPGGQFMSWTGSALVPGLIPIARGFMPFPFEGVVARVVIPRGAPPGDYAWLSALAAHGTLNLVTPIAETSFTIVP
jgi:hypothetical protein